ncbi:MAG: oxygen-independent coproporphyrinogen III oxidase [Alphaproteobacteria bacterium]|nr:oxygen-independent coproporphyrinogen III oxidase [Alphaproteobacteria bacterium]
MPQARWSSLADARVPRYTSYPTAPHFTGQVGATQVRAWLGALDPAAPVSLYLHVPFCRQLCLYCGCNTAIVSRHRPIGAFVDDLLAEIDLVASLLPGRLPVGHVHFGGGTPSILAPREFAELRGRLEQRFALAADAEIAIEIDPRGLSDVMVTALARNGVNRASLGVQDFDADVQKAIHREQSPAMVASTVARLRAAGIGAINFDLIYGLPRQTVASIERTVDLAAAMRPDRVALFGYAHVPWMKPHQKTLERHGLPDGEERWAMAEAASARLVAQGYARIGLDHFALPDDSMARAVRAGGLRRNFQGYTTDSSETLLGFGPSAISALPQGYAQAITDTAAWAKAVGGGELPVARGRAIDDEDRLRRSVIERLMCDLAVDLGAVARAHGRDPARAFAAERPRLAVLEADGVLAISGDRVRVNEAARPLVRGVAAVFDAYLKPDAARHAVAV